MNAIATETAPAPAGHYAQAISHGELLYVSGQLPINAQTGEKVLGDIGAQTRQVLENVSAILAAGNSDLSSVLKATVYISDIALWDDVNTVFAEYFAGHRPARVVVPTRELHFGFKVEMEVTAVVRPAT